MLTLSLRLVVPALGDLLKRVKRMARVPVRRWVRTIRRSSVDVHIGGDGFAVDALDVSPQLVTDCIAGLNVHHFALEPDLAGMVTALTGGLALLHELV